MYRKKYKINFKKLITMLTLSIILLININKFFPIMGNIQKNNVESSNILESPKELVPPTPKKTDIMPGCNVTYGGEKYSIPAKEVAKLINIKKDTTQNDNSVQATNTESNIESKYVFLTFDDGPSPNTEKILDILKEKDVRATFFVLGNNLENYANAKSVLKRCIEEENAIANHTYSHNLKTLYPGNIINPATVLDEFNKTNNLIKSFLGNNFDTRVLRLPGGYVSREYYKDPMLSSFNDTLKTNNIVSIDWNALNGDAEGKKYNVTQLLENSQKSSADKNNIVILMHDTYGKETTVQMLPSLIDYYKNRGYEFKTINSSLN